MRNGKLLEMRSVEEVIEDFYRFPATDHRLLLIFLHITEALKVKLNKMPSISKLQSTICGIFKRIWKVSIEQCIITAIMIRSIVLLIWQHGYFGVEWNTIIPLQIVI